MSGSSKLLIDEHPLQVLPSLAVAVGLNEAIILQQIHYWLRISEQSKDKNKFRDGCWWTYGTVTEWQTKNFPFWSESTVQRAFANLEKMGVLISKKFNAPAWDHTKWYTVDYTRLDASVVSKCDDRLPQNDVIDDVNMTQPKDPNCGDVIESKTTPETTPETIQRVICAWKNLFPKKPQPREETYREKIAARLKDKHFCENWEQALKLSSQSPTCQTASWFNFEFFVKNERNYQKMLERWMDWKDQDRNEKAPQPVKMKLIYDARGKAEEVPA